jgi:L-alanine-DL-glutamate epimerase-like enolase superfamily enzyme
MDMKLKSIEPIAVRLPLRRTMKTSQRAMRVSENVLVRVESDDGLVGWGEAASAPTMTGETMESMVAAIRLMAGQLVAQPVEALGSFSSRMAKSLYGNSAAKAAIDIAVSDLLGKAKGKPIWELLGTRRRDRVPALWMLAEGNVDHDVEEARRKREDGYVAFKIKVGGNAPEADALRTSRICDAVGPGHLVSADANQGWTVAQALAFLREINPAPLTFLEQPIKGADLDGMAEIAANGRVLIGCDEGIHSVADIERHHRHGAASGGSLKIIKMGGLPEVMAAAGTCESLGMKVNLACKIAESGIGTAAVLQLAAVIPSIDWGVSLSTQYLAEDLLTVPLDIAHGYARIPDGAGLGIEVDEERIRRFQVNM